MSASGYLPLCERAQRAERPGCHRVQKTGRQDCKWSRCWVCLAPYGLKSKLSYCYVGFGPKVNPYFLFSCSFCCFSPMFPGIAHPAGDLSLQMAQQSLPHSILTNCVSSASSQWFSHGSCQ